MSPTQWEWSGGSREKAREDRRLGASLIWRRVSRDLAARASQRRDLAA